MKPKITYALSELRRELIDAYRLQYKEDAQFINWSDAVCSNFAEHISNTIKAKFTEEQLYRQDNKVSETTIQRMVSGKLIVKEDMHWTTRRVLDNVCMYLKYDNWNAFVDFKNKKFRRISNGNISLKRGAMDYDELVQLIQNAKQAEFDVYSNLPLEDYDNLKKYYDECGREYQRILRNVYKMQEAGLVLNKENSRSRFSIDKVVALDLAETDAVFTQEYWHLEWLNQITGSLKYYFSLITFQLITISEGKIYFIEYTPYCKRDKGYVDRIYQSQTVLDEDDVLDNFLKN